MDQSGQVSTGNNSDRMEVGGEESETGYLQEMSRVEDLDQSTDSLQGSYTVPMFNMDHGGSLQDSQGFKFSGAPAGTTTGTLLQTLSGNQPISVTGESTQPAFGIPVESNFGSSSFILSANPQQTLSSTQQSMSESGNQTMAQATPTGNSANTNLLLGVGIDNLNQDVKPVLIPSDFSTLNLVGTGQQNQGGASLTSQNETVLNTGAFVMSLQNNPGIITFGQANDQSGDIKSDNNVFTFVKEYDSAKLNATPSTVNVADISMETGQTESKATRGKSNKQRPRKNRAQSTSNENTTKTEPQQGGSPSKMEPGETQSTGELGFKPSLLDEILTEKKLALMRSPEVIQFLQAQQKKITHGQYTES